MIKTEAKVKALICEAYGKATIWESMVKGRSGKFHQCQFELENIAKSVRLKETDDMQLQVLLDEDAMQSHDVFQSLSLSINKPWNDIYQPWVRSR